MNKERYLIALDMDGTLLNKNEKILFNTLMYIRKLTRLGHIVVLSSGRPIRSLMPYYKALGLKSPLICYNGAYCFHPYEKDFEEINYSFSKELVRSLYVGLYPSYIDNMVIENHDMMIYQNEDDTLYRFFPHRNIKVKYSSVFKNTENVFSIIMSFAEAKYIDNIKEEVKKYPDVGVRFWSGNKPRYCEIYYKEVSKAKCLRHIAEYYRIDRDHIIAIGDSINDIEMIRYAGTGIAMKNSCPELIAEANLITERDNNHNGIIATLRKVIK